mmetsp:Transcript_8184/g.19364  ORF Transcript_8184/g.19364 Transcript_8184/m.19364 type:complete len:261 (+) Transcript_8184:1244-2026(+)
MAARPRGSMLRAVHTTRLHPISTSRHHPTSPTFSASGTHAARPAMKATYKRSQRIQAREWRVVAAHWTRTPRKAQSAAGQRTRTLDPAAPASASPARKSSVLTAACSRPDTHQSSPARHCSPASAASRRISSAVGSTGARGWAGACVSHSRPSTDKAERPARSATCRAAVTPHAARKTLEIARWNESEVAGPSPDCTSPSSRLRISTSWSSVSTKLERPASMSPTRGPCRTSSSPSSIPIERNDSTSVPPTSSLQRPAEM